MLGQERTVTAITIAHLVYKCLMKMALWSWPRIIRDDKGELSELKEWVSIMSILIQIFDLFCSSFNYFRVPPFSLGLFRNYVLALSSHCEASQSPIQSLLSPLID